MLEGLCVQKRAIFEELKSVMLGCFTPTDGATETVELMEILRREHATGKPAPTPIFQRRDACLQGCTLVLQGRILVSSDEITTKERTVEALVSLMLYCRFRSIDKKCMSDEISLNDALAVTVEQRNT